ncbi:MAG: hypothetical protein GF317_23600 [Candidatus Lokiarchaeota archaeon]|nr:hypothetical protein [Candidatus Lokiarchaeota archaeon]MBD3202357.1 hypothetical protein [Candidatus Lokiarchaeota archaeon]
MAKKENEDSFEDELDDLEEFEDEEFGSVYPTIDKEAKETSTEEVEEDFSEVEDEELKEELDFAYEEQEEEPTFKYLSLQILEAKGKDNYEVYIKNQSHGFLNVLVKHLLDLEGVSAAAYKKTDIDYPKIFIKLEDGYKIKEILRKGINNLQEEVLEVKEIFEKKLL